MSPRVRTVSFHVILFSVLAFATSGAPAQTAIDDVHIVPREKPVSMASAAYATDPAERLTAGLIRTSVDLVLVPVSITCLLYTSDAADE